MVSPKVLWPVTSSIVKCMYIQINVQFISALEQSSIHDMTEDFQNKNTVLYSVFTKILKNNQNKVFEYVFQCWVRA